MKQLFTSTVILFAYVFALSSLSARAQNAFIQIRQNALSEEISPDFSYNVSGAGTYSATLNDMPAAINIIFAIAGDKEGGLYAIANTTSSWSVNPGNIYYKASGVSQWINTGNQALKVQGGSNGSYISLFRDGTTNSALRNTGSSIKYRANAAAAEVDITYNLAGQRFMDVAHNFDDMMYVLVRTGTDIGTIYKKSLAGVVWESTGITDVHKLTAVPDTDEIFYAKYTSPNINFIFRSSNENTGTVAWGNPIPDWDHDKIEELAVTYNEAGLIEVWALSVALVYHSGTAGSWTMESGINDMRKLCSTGGKMLNAVLLDDASVNIPYRIFQRTQDGFYLDDEKVRTGIHGNLVNIPVSPGTYTITQTPQAGWHLTDIRVNETDQSGTITNFSGDQVTVVVSAEEVVVVEFENQLTISEAIGQTCGVSFIEDFSSFANGDFGDPMTGLTNYHKATGNFGYGHYAIMSNTNALTYGDPIYDHTSGNAAGSMLVVDATFEKSIFYRRRFSGLLPGAKYSFGAWATNYNPPAGDKPNISFEIYDLDGGLIASANTGDILTSEWSNFTTVFTSNGDDIELVLRNNTQGTAGNDLAIDDISFGLAIPQPTADIIYDCASGTASLTVTSPLAIGSGDGYEYSIDGFNWQADPVFAGLVATNYTLQVRYEAAPMACTSSALFEVKACVTFSGNVFNDANGNFVLDGTAETGTNAGGQLYVYLVERNSGKIVDAVPVAANGAFTLEGVTEIAYQIELSSVQYTVGGNINITPIDNSLPPGWVNVAEGSATTSDGDTDGMIVKNEYLFPANVVDQNFAIQRPPDSDTIEYSLSTQPTGGSFYPLNGGANAPVVSGSDPEDGDYLGNTGSVLAPRGVIITSLPSNGTLWYDDEMVTSVDVSDSTLFENPYLFRFQFTGSGYNVTVFEYAYMDAAGWTDPTPATYTIQWTSPLPISLGKFDAIERHLDVALLWTTLREKNNRGFEVERSADAADWTRIGFVDTRAQGGNSSVELTYSYIDVQPLSGRNYYRLKQTDLDGSAAYSEVAMVDLKADAAITLHPNPVFSILTINGLKQATSVSIRNAVGQELMTSAVASSATQTFVEVASLPNGTYYLSVLSGDKILDTIRFIKQ